MTCGKTYKVTKEIKLHTKPLRTAVIVQEGVLKKKTEKNYIFDSFRVSKTTIVKFEEIKKEKN